MKPLSKEMRKLLAKTTIKEYPDDYSIVFIDPKYQGKARSLLKDLRPYSSVTYTEEEVSVVLRASDWDALEGSFPESHEEGPYRLLTFDIVLDLSIVGFLSVVSTALAEEGVSIYAVSTYLKDHILVKKADEAKAIEALRRLVRVAKTG